MTANEIGKGYQTYLSNNWSESEIDMNSSDEEEQQLGNSRGNKKIVQETRSDHLNALLPKESESRNQLFMMQNCRNVDLSKE